MPARWSDAADHIIGVAVEQECDGIIVGLPVTRHGKLWRPHTDSRVGRRCRSFAMTVAALAKRHSLPVFLVNEARTTIEAEELMEITGRRKKYRKVCSAVEVEKHAHCDALCIVLACELVESLWAAAKSGGV